MKKNSFSVIVLSYCIKLLYSEDKWIIFSLFYLPSNLCFLFLRVGWSRRSFIVHSFSHHYWKMLASFTNQGRKSHLSVSPKFVQSNLCTTTTLGTLNLRPLLKGGRCLEVALCYENWKWDPKMVVAVGRW